jgi:hypothetical protein
MEQNHQGPEIGGRIRRAEKKDEYLSDEQKEHFLATAKGLFEEGHFDIKNAGSLNG